MLNGILGRRRTPPADEQLTDAQYRLTLALYEVQDFLAFCAAAGPAIPRSQVSDRLLDLRNTLTPPDPR